MDLSSSVVQKVIKLKTYPGNRKIKRREGRSGRRKEERGRCALRKEKGVRRRRKGGLSPRGGDPP